MLVDANLLLYARDTRSPFHEAAKAWLSDSLNGPVRVGLPWPALVAFVRISTHPRAYDVPLTSAEAWQQVEEWLSAPASWIPSPTEAHATVLGTLVARHDLRGTSSPTRISRPWRSNMASPCARPTRTSLASTSCAGWIRFGPGRIDDAECAPAMRPRTGQLL